MSHLPSSNADSSADLVERIQDSDERVRAAICKVLGSLSYDTALHHVSQQLLQAVGGRVSDKKVSFLETGIAHTLAARPQ